MSEKPYTDGYFTVRDGLKLHFRDYPGSADRPPLLCLPGLTRNARDFTELAERYSPRFRVLALDFRGRALSDYDPDPTHYHPLVYAHDVIDLLDHLAVPQAIFIGTSLGGLVTMSVAALALDRIAAAILNDIGPEIDPIGIDRIKSYVGSIARFKSWDEAANAVAANNAQAFETFTHDDWLRMAQRNCREENGEIVFDYDVAIALPFNRAPSNSQFDMWPLFTALAQKPLLVIRGVKSDLLAADTLEKMHAAAPGMQSASVAKVGHAPGLGEPEAVAAIDAFLSEYERSL